MTVLNLYYYYKSPKYLVKAFMNLSITVASHSLLIFLSLDEDRELPPSLRRWVPSTLQVLRIQVRPERQLKVKFRQTC